MQTLLLALISASIATLCGRQAVRVARLSAALGGALPLLVAGWLACALASLLAARLGAALANGLGPEAKATLAVIALLLAAVELIVRPPGRVAAEPTRALGAVLLVLVAAQLTAAAGLLVFALAAVAEAPWPVAAGGALGSGAVFTGAWSMAADWEARLPLGLLRRAAAAMLLAAALTIGLPPLGWL